MLISDLALYAAGFILNLLAAFVIVRFIYYPRGRNNNYVFTFLAFNAVIYFIMGLFTSVELSIGAGFGLFALFSILRYRTETVPIREMTYLFVMAVLPLLNSVLWSFARYDEMLIANILVILTILGLDRAWGFRREQHQMDVIYEKIDLIQHERKEEMLADLRRRTGLNVSDAEVLSINFLRDTAEVRITYSKNNS